MAQIPNTKLELHPSMFDLLMTVLAYNAANAPVESVRSGAKDLMEKRMRFTRLYMSKDGEQYASLCRPRRHPQNSCRKRHCGRKSH